MPLQRRRLTPRQLHIVNYIAKAKGAGQSVLDLDEVISVLHTAGDMITREAAIISMKSIVKRLTEGGVFIEPIRNIGRGKRKQYSISR